ncbi:hypothetical protein KIH31_15275 [Paenarthrobacter sp. DKR-5]|uniref:hypothetical protein n=1 Tax=Paenarthrobacter sp. DKR-5 TaxID=2835535 RepID=UPI001BDC84F2|nr:hypothetical protein [Paenarthrobacter sp. DKR-5]MBT1003951.1 hypothetical protein [Paenarthrobacter sp. DKR-5]
MNAAVLPARLARGRLLGTGGLGNNAPAPKLNLVLGHPGTCPAEPTLTICIFDDSGSMLGGADSTGERYTEAGIVFDRISRSCRCDREKAAILHMNRPTSADRAPLALNRRARSDFAGALTVPTDGDGASTMGATLEKALQIARAHPSHRTALLCFSDFELTDTPARLAADLAAFPGDVHAVVMRSEPPQELLNQEAITITRIAAGAAPGAVARALFHTLTIHRPGAAANARNRTSS